MTETSFERRERRDRELDAFIRSKPEPMATAEEVLEVPCRTCGAEAGTACDTSHGRPTLLFIIFPGFGSHTSRYQDRSGDLR
jgi:hypothetical protein